MAHPDGSPEIVVLRHQHDGDPVRGRRRHVRQVTEAWWHVDQRHVVVLIDPVEGA